MDAKVEAMTADALSIHAVILTERGNEWVPIITNLLQLTDNCVKLLSFLAADLAKASGDSDSLHHTAGAGNGSAAKAEAYFRLDVPFRKWLAGIDPMQTDIAKAEQDWKIIVRRTLLQFGEEITHLSGEKAITGRWVKGRLYTAPGALAKFRSKVIRTIRGG